MWMLVNNVLLYFCPGWNHYVRCGVPAHLELLWVVYLLDCDLFVVAYSRENYRLPKPKICAKNVVGCSANKDRHWQVCKRTCEGCSWAQWSQLGVPHDSTSICVYHCWLLSGHRRYGTWCPCIRTYVASFGICRMRLDGAVGDHMRPPHSLGTDTCVCVSWPVPNPSGTTNFFCRKGWDWLQYVQIVIKQNLPRI